ncbi:MAG TPA: hypothetical protein VIL78_11245 [Hanamia sp.]|jgi:hypothetical protein
MASSSLEDHLPTIDFNVLHNFILSTEKIQSHYVAGTTTLYIKIGPQELGKRKIYVRSINDQVNFNRATSAAIQLGFIGELLNWYENNRNWKDGGYFV